METEVIENGVKEKSSAEKCSEEVNEILKKYKCQLVCDRQIAYGQVLYVPTIAPLPEK